MTKCKDIDLKSIYSFATLWRGRGNMSQGEFRAALVDFEKCLETSMETSDWLLQVTTLLSLAELYLHLRDNEKVIACCLNVAMSPESPESPESSE